MGMNLNLVHSVNVHTMESHISVETLASLARNVPWAFNDIWTFMPIYVQTLTHFKGSVAKLV